MSTSFFPLRIGGGGYLTSIDISPDGLTRVVQTDTYGAYVWNFSTSWWDQIIRVGTMPAGYAYSSGVWAIRVAPSNSAIVYMMFDGNMFKSTDRGVTWTLLSNFTRQASNANSQPYRFIGPKMAVSPTDPLICYIGTENAGVWYTLNGGTSWTHETTIPTAGTGTNGNSGAHTVNFDTSSTKVYISSYGNGMYKGTAGGTFSHIASSPSTHWIAKVHTDGILYMTDDMSLGNNNIWKYVDSGPTWTNITPSSNQFGVVVCDPNNSARVLVGDGGGKLRFTANRGTSFSALVNLTRTASDVPWLATTNEFYMSEGDMIFDPLVANRVHFGEGIGVWYSDVGTTTPSSIDWQSYTSGIEQLVANCVVCTPNNDLVVASWDRAFFRMDRSGKDTYRSNQQYDTSVAINHGWHIDYATSSASFLVGVMDQSQGGSKRSSTSSDGGTTWTEFPAYPTDPSGLSPWSGGYGGTSAVSTPSNWIWSPQENQDLWQTKNGGTTWTRIAISGVPVASGTGVETGWGVHGYIGAVRHIAIAADRVTLNKFYAFNCGDGVGSFAGLYKSTDSGDTWNKVFSGNITSYVRDFWSCQLKSVPMLGSANTAGHLFYATGFIGGTQPDTNCFFRRWTDTSATWTTITNVVEVYAFGFGACAPGKDYPTVYIVGYVNPGSGYDYGIWQGVGNSAEWDTNTQVWTKLTTYPYNWADTINTVDGDKTTYGTFYIGFQGSGYAYGVLDGGAATPAFGFSVITDSGQRRTKMIGY